MLVVGPYWGQHPSGDGKLTGNAWLLMQISPAQTPSVSAKSRPGRPNCCKDCSLAASGMLYRGLGQEGEEMVGRFAERNAGKDRRMNLLVLELEVNSGL